MKVFKYFVIRYQLCCTHFIICATSVHYELNTISFSLIETCSMCKTCSDLNKLLLIIYREISVVCCAVQQIKDKENSFDEFKNFAVETIGI